MLTSWRNKFTIVIVAACVLFWFKKILVNEQRKFACWHSETLFSHFVNTLSLGDRMAVSLEETAWKKLLESTHREESCAPQHYQLVNWHRLWFQNSVYLPLGHMNVRHWQMELLIIKFPSCGSISMKINSLYIETTTGLRYCKVKPRLHGSEQFFWTDKYLQGSRAFRLHGTRGTVQVFERQAVLQSVTEFARFRLNGLHR